MSEFTRTLVATTAAFAVGAGSFAAAREMKADYNQNMLNCQSQPTASLVEQCENGYGTDYSDLFEMLGFGALSLTVLGGIKTFSSINQTTVRRQDLEK